MSLIRCPSCRKIINNKAVECPKCGHSFRNNNPYSTISNQANETKTVNPKEEAKQQVKYLEVLLRTWFADGPDLWDYDEDCVPPASIFLGNKSYTPYELNDLAVQCKRKGDYAESIGAYIRILDSFYKKNHKIPYSTVRGLIKTLICTNNFHDAFVIASTALADAQSRYDVNPRILPVLQSDFNSLEMLAKKVIDGNNTSSVLEYAANYSGSNSYQLQKSMVEIKEELSQIRNIMKRYTGE